MEEKTTKKLNKNHICFIIYGALSLIEIGTFWLLSGNEAATPYINVGLYLILPLGALFASYMMTVDEAPKGWKRYMPIIFGVALAAVQFLTFGIANAMSGNPVSVSLFALFFGAIASLVGLSFAKKDRIEHARAEKARKKREMANGNGDEPETAYEPIRHEDDYDPGREFIPDAEDTWADEVIAREGFGEMKVDFAEYDADFSIDLPDNEEANQNDAEACEEVDNEAFETEDIEESDKELAEEAADEPVEETANEALEESSVEDQEEAFESGEAEICEVDDSEPCEAEEDSFCEENFEYEEKDVEEETAKNE